MTQETTLEFIELATEIIDDFVEEPNAVWVSIGNGELSDDNEPWNVTRGTTEPHDIRIVFLQDTKEDRQLLKYLKGRVVNSGQVNAIMYQQGFDPKLKDIVEWEGQQLEVRAIDPVQVIDKPIIYIMEFGS